MQHRGLGQRTGDLVGAGQHRVGALRLSGRRQRFVEAEVGAPTSPRPAGHTPGMRDLSQPATSAVMPK